MHKYTYTQTHVLFVSTGLVSVDADVALTNTAAPIKKITKDKGWATHTHTDTHARGYSITQVNLNPYPFSFDN